MLLLEVISGEVDHWPWECQVGGASLAQENVLPAGFCRFGNAALARGLLLSRWSGLALGLLKEVGGDLWKFI